MTATAVDLFDRSLYTGGVPHEVLGRIRDEQPVHWARSPATLTDPYSDDLAQPDWLWHVFGHPEVRQANRDWETFSAKGGPTVTRGPEGGAGMLSLDPPEHHRLRHVVASSFTPRVIATLQERIDGRVVALLDAVGTDEFDFVEAVAYPLPMHVIADIIGIPESDRPWVFEQAAHMLDGLDPDADTSQHDGGLALFEYAQRLGADKRAAPTDDVWSTIISQGLSEHDVDLFFVILALAGSETTRNALSQGAVAFHDNPTQFEAVRQDPGLLDRTGTDEILRFTSPVLTFGRDVTRDTHLGEQTMKAGDRVVLWHAVANRDPRVFDEPQRLLLDRDPNPHVAFGGGGPHYCLGANLAKREITALFNTIAQRGHVEVVTEPIWSGPGPISNVGCSISGLRVRLTGRTAGS